MTVQQATAARERSTITIRRPAPPATATRSFSEALIDAALDLPASNDRPFGGGTMRDRVEAFGAHGLLDEGGSKELGSGDEGGDEATASAGPEDRRPPAQLAPESDTGVDAAAGSEPEDTVRQSRTDGGGTGLSGAGGMQEAGACTTEAFPASAGTAASAAPIGVADRTSSTTTDRAVEPGPSERPSTFDRPERAASALQVALDAHGAEAVVSVGGSAIEPEDGDALHEAVSRLLASHGLSLGELRATRRARRGGTQQGRS